MVIYNVTINVGNDVVNDWIVYMRDQHIPDVMKTGCFIDFKFCRILTRQEDESGHTFAVQYHCNSMDDYHFYKDNHASDMQRDHMDKFGGKFVAFRTLLEEIG